MTDAPESLLLGFLPVSFLQTNKAAAVMDAAGNSCFVVAEPYNEGLTAFLRAYADKPIAVTEPENIELLFAKGRERIVVGGAELKVESPFDTSGASRKWESAAMANLSNVILVKTVLQGEKGVVIEPRNPVAYIRFGAQKPFQVMAKTGAVMTMHYKMLSGLDVTDNTNPQSGGFTINFAGKKYKVNITTAPSAQGENCSVNISEA